MREPEESPRPAPIRRGETQRLPADAPAERPATLNADWRRQRLGRSESGRLAQRIPTSAEDLPGWLQHGGWRYVLAGAALVVGLFIVLLALTGPPVPAIQIEATSVPETGAGGGSIEAPLPTVLATAAPTAAAPAAPAQPAGQVLVVTGTGNQGLFLRDGPGGNIIKTLPEGTRVTVVGDDQVTAERVWKRVRDDTGAEGYAAADFLQAAP